ncbi:MULTISPECIES: DNA-binding transcriptional regulator [unclassified Gluconobacter]|uniref:helix-turn-helix domain-containing protein n=1 Tax=unclassified Gluconobacter TaxID=2644261 RepID=UPI001C041CE6|nr:MULTISPECIES: helix-turn-helix transcriptional regulator [unclassified Gluconobacter]
MMTKQEFAEALTALHWSQRGLAEILNTHPTTVRRWANGEQDLPDVVTQWLNELKRVLVDKPRPSGWEIPNNSVGNDDFLTAVIPKYTESLVGWIKFVSRKNGLHVHDFPEISDVVLRIENSKNSILELSHPHVDSEKRIATYWLKPPLSNSHGSSCIILRPEGASLTWYEWVLRTVDADGDTDEEDRVCDYFLSPEKRREYLINFINEIFSVNGI